MIHTELVGISRPDFAKFMQGEIILTVTCIINTTWKCSFSIAILDWLLLISYLSQYEQHYSLPNFSQEMQTSVVTLVYKHGIRKLYYTVYDSGL